jgi:hypothetical protein
MCESTVEFIFQIATVFIRKKKIEQELMQLIHRTVSNNQLKSKVTWPAIYKWRTEQLTCSWYGTPLGCRRSTSSNIAWNFIHSLWIVPHLCSSEPAFLSDSKVLLAWKCWVILDQYALPSCSLPTIRSELTFSQERQSWCNNPKMGPVGQIHERADGTAAGQWTVL